jgi:phosphatidate cytidylyltransferase
LYASVAWWLFATYLVVIYPVGGFVTKNPGIRLLMGLFVLLPCWVSIHVIHYSSGGPYRLLFLFALIWGADAGAYFVGKRWGCNKLAPRVSPGKTIQGLIGALVTALLIAMLGAYFFKVAYHYWPAVLALSASVVLFSIVGDLFESLLKRQENLKDSGRLLPGHGGIMDRIDSLTAAAPVFLLGTLLLQTHITRIIT